MNLNKGAVWTIGLSALLVFAVACGKGEAAETPANGDVQAAANGTANIPTDDTGSESPAGSTEPAPPIGQPVTGGPAIGVPASGSDSTRGAEAVGFSAGAGQASVPTYQVGSTQAGIWVSGQGKLSLTPDIALVRLGVETTAKTVTEARDEAATAMANIVTAIEQYRIVERDIQTTSFNIWPEYQYQEITKDGIQTNVRILIGYRVSNTAIIKVRDINKVGAIIDDVVNAGGDPTRINGIDFSVENTKLFQVQLREEAVKAALQNAQQFASLTGVALGKLMYISETGVGGPAVRDFADDRAFGLAAAAPTTSIGGGSLGLTMTVQAVFAIE
jgi:uncharacterized protein YggE